MEKRNVRSFDSLSEREVLSLAIALEEEDAKIYDNFAEGLREAYPEQATIRRDAPRRRRPWPAPARTLSNPFRRAPPLDSPRGRPGLYQAPPCLVGSAPSLRAARKLAELMDLETERFYEVSARRASDGIRKLLLDFAAEEHNHALAAEPMGRTNLTDAEAAHEKRRFALQVIQPGLAGLMDGSVSTLAPLFAARFATGVSSQNFSRRPGRQPWRGHQHGLCRAFPTTAP